MVEEEEEEMTIEEESSEEDSPEQDRVRPPPEGPPSHLPLQGWGWRHPGVPPHTPAPTCPPPGLP